MVRERMLHRLRVNQDFSVYALQEEIANVVALDNLSNEKEVQRRAGLLCYGLPLGIIEIATCMRGVEKVHEWRGMLGKLEDSRMELDVFKRLQLSYLNLGGIGTGQGLQDRGNTILDKIGGKLGSLRKLDVEACDSLEEVPEGMEMLVNLRYLALDGTKIETLLEGDGTSGDGCALLLESLQSLELSGCHKMKRLMEWEWLTTRLPNLEEIIINSCEKLEEIIHGPLPNRATCRLTYLEVNGCNNMKRVLLTQDMLLHLPFLQSISIKDCKGIEVIIGTVAKTTHCSFPKLMDLDLWNLLEPRSICDGTTSCESLRWISVDNCLKLKRIPLQLPLLDNGLPLPPPSFREIRINRQLWELLEWDHPLARSSLEHFLKFLD
ncbi:hypothetical protein NL676_024218 [Syzygium grande]|nr:hypothetical protein NL676_024218 [Syzygium grande]